MYAAAAAAADERSQMYVSVCGNRLITRRCPRAEEFGGELIFRVCVCVRVDILCCRCRRHRC